MAEDLQSNLQNYKLQLQQVEAALTTDSNNEELLKLKHDLDEVIELTCDLIKTQSIESKQTTQKSVGPGSSQDITNQLLPAELQQPVIIEDEPAKKDWKVGDRCLAIWSKDTLYYEATITEISEDGEDVTVVFDNYRNTESISMSLLRELKSGSKRALEDPVDGKSKKIMHQKQREYQKKKKQKKLQRYKQIEEEREGEKNKWLQFNTKKKGVFKKSIFASPDNINGRVGIGTCGMSGRPMTEFTTAEKWRKGV